MVKNQSAKKDEKELQKEVEKQQRIADDKHGRGRYFEPDILTRAAIEERQAQLNTSYKRTDSYNLNYKR